MSSDIIEEPVVKAKAHKSYKERQEEKEQKVAAKEALKEMSLDEKAAQLALERATKEREKASNGSASYKFTPTGGAKKGRGTTIVSPTPLGRLGKHGRRQAGKMEMERIKEARLRRKEATRDAD